MKNTMGFHGSSAITIVCGAVTAIITAFCVMLLIPSNVQSTVLIEIYRALIDVAGVLVGLVGIVGVFVLQSIGSSISDTQREAKEKKKARDILAGRGGGEIYIDLDREVGRLERIEKGLRKVQNTAIKMVFAVLMFFTAQILCDIIGIANSSTPNPLLKVLLQLLPIYFLIYGIFATFVLTQLPSDAYKLLDSL
jgi:uncharacterized membrane protein